MIEDPPEGSALAASEPSTDDADDHDAVTAAEIEEFCGSMDDDDNEPEDDFSSEEESQDLHHPYCFDRPRLDHLPEEGLFMHAADPPAVVAVTPPTAMRAWPLPMATMMTAFHGGALHPAPFLLANNHPHPSALGPRHVRPGPYHHHYPHLPVNHIVNEGSHPHPHPLLSLHAVGPPQDHRDRATVSPDTSCAKLWYNNQPECASFHMHHPNGHPKDGWLLAPRVHPGPFHTAASPFPLVLRLDPSRAPALRPLTKPPAMAKAQAQKGRGDRTRRTYGTTDGTAREHYYQQHHHRHHHPRQRHLSHSDNVGAYSPAARRSRIQIYLEKRKRRVWSKKVKYDVRKNFADSRMRVKGRFVKKEDEDLLKELVTYL